MAMDIAIGCFVFKESRPVPAVELKSRIRWPERAEHPERPGRRWLVQVELVTGTTQQGKIGKPDPSSVKLPVIDETKQFLG
jgi:hypothetical protein